MASNKFLDINGLLYVIQKIKFWLSSKVDKETGKSLVPDTEIARLSSINNYDDTTITNNVNDLVSRVDVLETSSFDDTQLLADIAATYETKINVANHTNNVGIHVSTEDRLKWNASQANTIESLKVNGAAQTITNKVIDISVPTTTSVLVNDSGYVSATDLSTGYYNKAQIDEKVTSAFIYKGSVATYADLPTVGLQVGHVYNVVAASEYNKAEENMAWNGTQWDRQGGIADLSDYVLSSDILAITNAEIDTIVTS